MEIGQRVGVYVATLNNRPVYEPGTVEQVSVSPLGNGRSVRRCTVIGDNGRRFYSVHPINLQAIAVEAQA